MVHKLWTKNRVRKILYDRFCLICFLEIFFSFSIRPMIQINDFYFISIIFIITYTCKLYRGGLRLDRVETKNRF